MDEDFRLIDNNLLIRMPTEIDHHKSVNISSKADRLILSKKVENVVFDFEQTTFMDSSGIAVLLRTWRRVQEADAAMEVTAVPRQPWKVFATAGLPKIIPMSTL